VNEIIADFVITKEFPASDLILELKLIDIFLDERGRLKRIIAGMGLNTADCEDVLQDVSVKALKNSLKIKTKQEGIRWLVKVTVNECLVEHRRRKSFRKKINEILRRKSQTKTTPADKKLIAAEELGIVRDSLKKLDDDLLGPIVLRYFCDMNSNEISEILEQNPSTVRGRLRDARMILAKTLLGRGVEP
jgi:RNA polymerase sigma factor (sigma-70 family)